MIIKVLLIIFFILFPALLIYLGEKISIINKIGTVVIAYLVGLIIGNTGILPEGSEKIQELIATITVPLSLPLLLFSTNIKAWFKLAGRTLLATFLAIIGLLAIIYFGNSIFEDKIPEIWKISGMLVGVYTGGTPNLASIKTALDVSAETYILVHTYDTVISAIFILFLITIGQRFFLLFLKPFKSNKVDSEIDDQANDLSSYAGFFKKNTVIGLLIALGISILILAIAGISSSFVPKNSSMAIAILSITTLGIIASLIPKINKIEKSFQLGMYLILIFSLDVASMANLSKLTWESLYLFYYILIAIFGTLVLQLILSRIFKIDADTTIIISTTLICSPPFVPVVASSLKNKQVIISGLTIGIIGYAIGNYMGIMLAWFFK